MNFLKLPNPQDFIKNFLEENKHKYFFHDYFKTTDFSDEDIREFVNLVEAYCLKKDDFTHDTDVERHIYYFIAEVWENIDNYYYFLNYGTGDIASIIEFRYLYHNNRSVEKWLESVGLKKSTLIKKFITEKEKEIQKYKKAKNIKISIYCILFLLFLIFLLHKIHC